MTRIILVSFLLAVSLSAQAPGASTEVGILTLTQDFGRALFSKCRSTVYYVQPHLAGVSRVELSCAPTPYPRVDDVAATRPLSPVESIEVARLTVAADLYSGGHAGRFGGTEGPWERLEVSRCCGREDTVVLITDGNPTFATGSRRELLSLLSRWRSELMPEVIKKLRSSR